ncbi:type II toxin-antitoxin system ParD family antitoxin [Brevundimonas sp.]|uniref:ribbon-helix-helix domain-containing protein n=1 Tax=Brevundimonas sp. TaxID=1871086 RepID=UPI0035616197
MGRHERISTDLPAYMIGELRAAVDAGEFASTDEAVREALTHWLVGRSTTPMTPDELRHHLQSERDGPDEDAEAVFDRLEAKYSALVAADQSKG